MDKSQKRVRRPPDVGRIIDRTIVRLWDTIEELEALNPAELHFYRVAVFGSARVQPGDKEYAQVREVASRLTEMGCDIVTGGGPGLMEAANEGAASSRAVGSRKTRSFGLTIAIPYEKANPYLDSVTAHRTFFSRLHHFVRMSQAFIVFPGGIGSTLELMMVWQLLQVGFMTERPVILVGDMWSGLLEWMRRDMVPRKLMNAEDLDLVHLSRTLDDAV
ncbi:MAG: LOG family protein, partial [Acidobacteriota bacterium]|nr:LOG family protein [Acidobacteriota bacterium]